MPQSADKRHPCPWSGCTKSFTRSDHLKRHALNHDNGNSTCHRCRAHFKRPDLLNRHMARHRQKDEEAGGEGLGHVETRKKLWCDDDGNIVQQRPLTQSALSEQQQDHAQQHEAIFDDHYDDLSNLEPGLMPISPPASSRSNELQNLGELDRNMDVDTFIEKYDDAVFTNFLANSAWGDQKSEADGLKRWSFDNLFKPDTASSFNMPFTTMSNYNWLFETSNVDPCSLVIGSPRDMQIPPPLPIQSSNDGSGLPESLNQQVVARGLQQPGNLYLQAHTSITRGRHTQRDQGSSQGIGTTEKQTELIQPVQELVNHENAPSPSSFSAFSGNDKSPHNSSVFNDNIFGENETAPSAGRPMITALTRQKLLDWIISAKPTTPEGNLISQDHPLLKILALQSYCDAFFDHFNTAYPLIHRALFDPEQVDTSFLLSVLLIGATYMDKTAHILAVCIHDVMRAQIFSHHAFSATPQLWMLQTILLVECFGKSRAGQKQHDMAHLFHGLLINLIRRSDCQTVIAPDRNPHPRNLEAQWRFAMDVEQRKRVAFLCFMWDTQHAVLFSQSLCMSAFELRSTLPCDTASWDASSAREWWQAARHEQPKLFLPVLKSYMTSEPQSIDLNSTSRLLILHGLMSISWDMRRREQTSLGVVNKESDWRARIGQAYDIWKADFDTFCMNESSDLWNDYDAKAAFTQFAVTTTAIYHAAHIILNADVLDLQINAGARHIIGRPVNEADRQRSGQAIEKWLGLTSASAATAAWHAAHLLRASILQHNGSDTGNTFHYPWCLYLATLAIWTFHAQDSSLRAHSLARTGKQSDAAEMNALISSMSNVPTDKLRQTTNKYSTHGLLQTMTKRLGNVRWAVIHEAVKVLQKLVNIDHEDQR